jgi:hypothetical protein
VKFRTHSVLLGKGKASNPGRISESQINLSSLVL